MKYIFIRSLQAGENLQEIVCCVCASAWRQRWKKRSGCCSRLCMLSFTSAGSGDAIIGHGLVHHTGLDEINDRLFAEGEKTLI